MTLEERMEIMVENDNTQMEKLEEMKDVIEVGFENINSRFDDMDKHIDEKFQDNLTQHKEIIEHQKHTNGDVKKLKLWQAGIIGGASVVAVFMGILSFVLKDQIAFFLHPDVMVKEAVEEAMKNTEIDINLYDENQNNRS